MTIKGQVGTGWSKSWCLLCKNVNLDLLRFQEKLKLWSLNSCQSPKHFYVLIFPMTNIVWVFFFYSVDMECILKAHVLQICLSIVVPLGSGETFSRGVLVGGKPGHCDFLFLKPFQRPGNEAKLVMVHDLNVFLNSVWKGFIEKFCPYSSRNLVYSFLSFLLLLCLYLILLSN